LAKQRAASGIHKMNRPRVAALNQVAGQAVAQLGRVLRDPDNDHTARVEKGGKRIVGVHPIFLSGGVCKGHLLTHRRPRRIIPPPVFKSESVAFFARPLLSKTTKYDIITPIYIRAYGSSAMGKGHTDLVWFLAWSPDSTRLVTGGFDSSIKVWGIPS
jgi:hypothetical protein